MLSLTVPLLPALVVGIVICGLCISVCLNEGIIAWAVMLILFIFLLAMAWIHGSTLFAVIFAALSAAWISYLLLAEP